MEPSTHCKACGEVIVWAKHYRTDKPAPIELSTSPNGNIFLRLETNPPSAIYEIVPKEDRDLWEGKLHLNHFATCPHAKEFSGDSR